MKLSPLSVVILETTAVSHLNMSIKQPSLSKTRLNLVN